MRGLLNLKHAKEKGKMKLHFICNCLYMKKWVYLENKNVYKTAIKILLTKYKKY